MMKSLSVSAVLALALAGAAHAIPQESTSEESGFNLMMPGDDVESSDDGWNLGVDSDVTEDGFVIPDGMVEDRLGDVAELPTGETAPPEVSSEIPAIQAPEDDPIRLN